MSTINATLSSVSRNGSQITLGVTFTRAIDSSLIATQNFVYNDPSTATGTQIIADVQTAGSVYITAITKETNLQSFVGTTISI